MFFRMLAVGSLGFLNPTFAFPSSSAKEEIKDALEDHFEFIADLVDWAYDAADAYANGKPLPLRPGGNETADALMGKYLDALRTTASNIDIAIPQIAPVAIFKPSQLTKNAYNRAQLRSQVGNYLRSANEAEKVEDYIKDAKDWCKDANARASEIIGIRDLFGKLFQAFPVIDEVTLAKQREIGLSTINLHETSQTAFYIIGQAEQRVTNLETKIAPVRAALRTQKSDLLQSLDIEQRLLQNDLDEFEKGQQEIETLVQRQRECETGLQQISQSISVLEKSLDDITTELDDVNESFKRQQTEVNRLMGIYTFAQSKANTPFHCPRGGHTRYQDCEDEDYKQKWLDYTTSYARERDNAQRDLQRESPKLETLRNRKTALDGRKEDTSRRLDRAYSKQNAERQRLALIKQKLSDFSKQFWEKAWENKAYAFKQESAADGANIKNSL